MKWHADDTDASQHGFSQIFLNMMNIKEIKYRTGKMTKPTSQMSPSEYEKWQEQSRTNIRNYLFSVDQPLVYYSEGIPVAEYKDGRIEKLR